MASMWNIVEGSGIGTLIGWALQTVTLRHDPAPPAIGEAVPDATAWPEWNQVAVHRPPGGAAYWNTWRHQMVIGRDWDVHTWTQLHVMAHELAHAQQSRGRLRWAEGWIKGVLLVSVAASFLGIFPIFPILGLSGWAGPLEAASLVFVGDAVWRWPLEAQADTYAEQRLVAAVSHPASRYALHQWGRRVMRRHRVALAGETVFWAGVAAVLVALTQALPTGHW